MTVRAAISSGLRLLAPRDRRLLLASIIIQMSTAFLDLVGVLLVGVVGALAVTTLQSIPPPEPIERVIDALGLGGLSSQSLVLLIAGAAATVFLVKSILSSYLTRRVFTFLANRQALVSARLTRELLSRPLTFVSSRSSQETAYALTGGVASATSQILGQVVVAASEIALLTVLGVALLLINPWTALGAIVFFALIALIMQRYMGGWAARLGSTAVDAEVGSLRTIQEALGSYREITVAHRRPFYVERFRVLRWQAAEIAANLQFIGVLPKYVFESALIVGAFLLAISLFATQDAVVAIGTLALFLAAGSRVMPSLLRLQSAALTLRASAGGATPAFALAADLGDPIEDPSPLPHADDIRARVRTGNPDFTPTIDIKSATLTYPGREEPAIRDISLRVDAGQTVALVGRSGAGKSTLADVILGVLEPDSGTAHLGNAPSTKALEAWPGGIAYVPQDVVLADDTIRGNVALGIPREAIDDELVWEALRRAHLEEFVLETPDMLNCPIGERGIRLSGGQRQRLGIARALYTRPKLLVLDEATSALDAETELSVTEMIKDLEGEVTIVVIAHRLSTVRDFDMLVYLDQGMARAVGSFDELKDQVPAFAHQASLMGLGS